MSVWLHLFILVVILVGSSPLGARTRPWVRVSLTSHTVRIHSGDRPDALFPAAVGRLRGGRHLGPQGRWFSGPDARDPAFFIASRREPSFYEGLPQLRLTPVALRGREDPGYRRAAQRPFFIHSKVTPSLIWGAVTAGCVRVQTRALKQIYALARRSPSLLVFFSEEPDPLRPAGTGVQPLRVLKYGRWTHGRLHGGVDHWFALDLQRGDVLSLTLGPSDGVVVMELYGIRAISPVARGELSLRYRVPLAASNRGFRYLRLVAPRGGASYALRAQTLR
ncbi:MAG: L,D-transpeptidase [Deltaproteobacteria bacterium]|nr:L,D-transpeptidase [Deltaproteobacteria bacterium]